MLLFLENLVFTLLVRGLYRYTRNPMYVGVLTVILGWTALFQAPILLLRTLRNNIYRIHDC
jgi:protein-S-isoprenylcysteine O-methyltransferase Ste14